MQLVLAGAMLFVAGIRWGIDSPPSMWVHFTWWTWTLTAVFFFVGFYAALDRTYDYLWHVFAFTATWASNWVVTLLAPFLFLLAIHLIDSSGFPLGVTLLGDRMEHVLPILSVLVYAVARRSALAIPLSLRRGFWRHLGVHTTSEQVSFRLRALSFIWVFIIAPLLPIVLYFIFIDPIYVYGIVTAYPALIAAVALVVSIAIALLMVFTLRYILLRAETLSASPPLLITTVAVVKTAAAPPPPYTPAEPAEGKVVVMRGLMSSRESHPIVATSLRRGAK